MGVLQLLLFMATPSNNKCMYLQSHHVVYFDLNTSLDFPWSHTWSDRVKGLLYIRPLGSIQLQRTEKQVPTGRREKCGGTEYGGVICSQCPVKMGQFHCSFSAVTTNLLRFTETAHYKIFQQFNVEGRAINCYHLQPLIILAVFCLCATRLTDVQYCNINIIINEIVQSGLVLFRAYLL